jgi:hypothetical protein
VASFKFFPLLNVAAITSVAIASIPAQALTFFGNLPLPNETLSTTVDSGVKFSFRFNAPTDIDYTFDSVDLRLFNYNTAEGDQVLLQIFEDNIPNVSFGTAGPPPFLLVPLTFMNPSSTSNALDTFRFRPSTNFTFKANATYWLLASAPAGAYSFRLSNPQTEYSSSVGVSNFFITRSTDDGVSYSLAAARPGLRVNATPVPFEFHGGFGVTVLAGAWWLARRRRKQVSETCGTKKLADS